MTDSLQSDYERTFLAALDLSREHRCDEAVATLAEFYASHRHEDDTGWLRNATLSESALLLAENGDYEGAIRTYRETNWPAESTSRYLNTAHALARLLVTVHKDSEAIQVLESSLAAAGAGHLESYVPLLLLLCDISGKLGLSVHHRDLVARMAKHWEVPIAEEALDDPIALAALVRDIVARLRSSEQNRDRT